MADFNALLAMARDALKQSSDPKVVALLEGETADTEAPSRSRVHSDTASLICALYRRAVLAGVLSEQDNTSIYDLESLYALIQLRLTESEIKRYCATAIEFPVADASSLVPACVKCSTVREAPTVDAAVEDLLSGITLKESKVIRYLYGINTGDWQAPVGRWKHTQAAVARLLGWPAATVGRIYQRALLKLRHPTRALVAWHQFKTIDPMHASTPSERFLVDLFPMEHLRHREIVKRSQQES